MFDYPSYNVLLKELSTKELWCPTCAQRLSNFKSCGGPDVGHDVEQQNVRGNLPKKLSVPGLPELNHSQVAAAKAVLQRRLHALIMQVARELQAGEMDES